MVGTLFADQLASGARDQIQDMDLIWPVGRHTRRRGNMRARVQEVGKVVFTDEPHMGVARENFFFLTSSFIPFFLLLLDSKHSHRLIQ